MGKNLAGICVNKGFFTDGFDLGRELELEWKYQKKVSPEIAFERHKKKGIYDVCFLENATLILTELDTGMWGRTSEDMEVFSFAIQESTMNFSFKLSINSKFEQRYFRVENDIVVDEVTIGEPLPIENLFDDYSDLIEAQIKKTTNFSIVDFSDKTFYRFKWVDSDKLLQDLDYALRSEYFYKFMDIGGLISSYSSDDQIRLFEVFHEYALDKEVDLYHYMTLGNSEGLMPIETVFKSNFQTVLKLLLEKPETESVVKKYYTKKQIYWLFAIDLTDENFYKEVLNDHLKTKTNLIQNDEEVQASNRMKKWWQFWK